MAGTIDSSWFCSSYRRAWQCRDDLGRPNIPAVQPRRRPWFHEAEGVIIPMPSTDELRLLESEHVGKEWGTPMGPLAMAFRARVIAWAAVLVDEFQDGGGVITGAPARNADRWRARLHHLQPDERQQCLHNLTSGLDWPWLDGVQPEKPCRYGGRRMRNHPDLHRRPDAVWLTLSKIFSTKSARWWDTKGGRRLPLGMHPIRWVQKGETDEVRITWNMRDFNKLLDPAASTVELDTASKVRHRVQRGDLMGGLDLSSSFYHAKYSDRAVTWTGAAVAPNELPPGVWDTLRGRHPNAYCRKAGKDWLVFVLLGVTMGAAPSVKQFTDFMAAPVQAWMRCPVGDVTTGTLESWRSTIYIDDLQWFVAGGFASAVELSLRLVAEMVILGFTVNFKPGKSQLLPDVQSRHIGYIWATLTMRIRLPLSRIAKTHSTIAAVRAQVATSTGVRGRDDRGRPQARTVARLIGLLWSAHMVAPRAVAILCRGMIATLARALGTDAIREACMREQHARLRWLLRAIYEGTVDWTRVADGELVFWESTDFAALAGDVAVHCLDNEFQEWCWRPARDVAASDVHVLAVDTSETASGGDEFIVDGNVWRLSDDGMMVTELLPHQIGTSSTARELKGCDDVDLICAPAGCTKEVVLCDNQATMRIMTKGSSIPELNEFAASVFKRALRRGKVLHFCWVGRNQSIIEQCDRGSRLALTSDVGTPAAIFWKANAEAVRRFGRGFQYDRFASADTACPPDTMLKLPFNSEYRAEGSEARDAMAQHWVGYINWVAPPFVFLDPVLDLMWGQGVAGALVVPKSSSKGKKWAARVRPGAVGVLGSFAYRPMDYGPSTYEGSYAVVFLDFRREGDPVADAASAESLRRRAPCSTGPNL